MPTTTQYYHLQLPDVGGSEDLWGGLLNGDLSQIDTQLYNRVVKSLTGSDTINGSPQVIDTALWVAAQQDGVSPVGGGNVQERSVATARWVETRVFAILNSVIPVGTIVLWSGTFASLGDLLSKGWALCNGLNGTPNLSDRVVLGAGNQNAPGEFGGIIFPGQKGIIPPTHYHAGTQYVPYNPGGPEFLDDYGGAPVYSGGSATIPYYTVCYMMKFAAWHM